MLKKIWLSAILLGFFPIAIITYQTFSSGDAHITPQPKPIKKNIDSQPSPDSHINPPIQTNNNNSSIPTQNQDQILKPTKKHNERVITVINKITKKMISYNKCFVSYAPNFALTVNNQILRPGREQLITITDNKLTVTYSYNFLNGYKKGKRSVEFEINPNQDLYEITFSWHNDWRIIIPQATPQQVNVIS